MSRYRRVRLSGGTFFFTLTLADRLSDALIRHIDVFRRAYHSVRQRRPFTTVAICVLPDHLHPLWTMPPDDTDYAMRWNLIKGNFSRPLPAAQSRPESQRAKREKGIWQRRYWEHCIRDDADLLRHVDYIHFNPVKHGLVSRVSEWPYSSFHAFVKRGDLPIDWGGDMREPIGLYGE